LWSIRHAPTSGEYSWLFPLPSPGNPTSLIPPSSLSILLPLGLFSESLFSLNNFPYHIYCVILITIHLSICFSQSTLHFLGDKNCLYHFVFPSIHVVTKSWNKWMNDRNRTKNEKKKPALPSLFTLKGNQTCCPTVCKSTIEKETFQSSRFLPAAYAKSKDLQNLKLTLIIQMDIWCLNSDSL
jgi:hypothetical protein